MTGTVTGVLGKGSSHRMGNDTVSGWLVWMRRPPGLMSSTRPRMVFLVDLGRPTGDSSRPTNSLLTGNLDAVACRVPDCRSLEKARTFVNERPTRALSQCPHELDAGVSKNHRLDRPIAMRQVAADVPRCERMEEM